MQWVSKIVGEGELALLSLSPLHINQLTASRVDRTAVWQGRIKCMCFLYNPFLVLVQMEIDEQTEQRIKIKFLAKLGKNGTEMEITL